MELTTHVKKYRIFSRVFNIANQLLTRHSPFAPFGQIEGWTAKLSLFSIQDRLSKIFVDYGCQNTEKSVSLTDSDVQTLLIGEENQNTEIKPKDTLFNGFGSGISLGWERKSTAGRFASRRFWPCTRKISSIGKDQVNNWEFCILKITPTVCFCSVAPLFSAWALAPTYWTIFIRDLSILLFSYVNKVEFFLVKGCCVHIINKIIHGCL